MMGYSKFGQNTTGIHQRLRSRAYITVDQATGQRVAYVNADLGMIFQAQRDAVLAKLQAKYGDLYTERNLLLSATHTHSGPGGQSHNLAYNLSILGFQKQAFDATVDGIVESITKAHQSLAPGTVSLGRSTLTNASVNRSRVAFDQNPAADKAAFPNAIDPAVTVLRFQQGGSDIGAISWFATHATSITNENTLISPDNKGYAAYRWEHDQKGVRYLDEGQGFVAAFPNTNAYDMSPNLNLKPGSGPTEDPLTNEQIIGQRQQSAAEQAYNGPQATIAGSIDARLRYVDMSAVQVDGRYTPDGEQHRTCPGVVGVSTLAYSVEDGPGIAIIPEGVTNPFFELLKPFKVDVPPWLISCQSPKLAAVPTGLLQATPDIVPIQLVKLGQFHLVAVPGEVTIVAGLRLRRTVAAELGVPLENVLIQGYANAYSQYVTTPEEYQLQQYEGGSTLFGKYTLPAVPAGVRGSCPRPESRYSGRGRHASAEARDGRAEPADGSRVRQPAAVQEVRPGAHGRGRVVPARRHRVGVVRDRASEEQPAPQRHVPRGAATGCGPMATSRGRRGLDHDVPVGADRAGRFEGDDQLEGDRCRDLPDRPPR